MKTTEYQPRYVAYCKAMGRKPEAQLAHDEKKYPGGKMCGFILWMSQQHRAFKSRHPESFLGDAIVDQDAYTRFLSKA